MKRKITDLIKEHFKSGISVPLLITGPRGVGKTYTVSELAENEFTGSIYINFETDAGTRNYFNGISKAMTEETDIEQEILKFVLPDCKTEEFLFVFDEIQACKGFCELMMYHKGVFNINIICISSFAEKTLKKAFKCIKMYPMDFDEFLPAIGKEWYKEISDGHFEKKKPLPTMVHSELLALFYDFLVLGGMPAVINEYIDRDNSVNIKEKQRNAYIAILNDIENYGPSGEIQKLKDILSVLAVHFVKDKKKFTFNFIRRGVTYGMYKSALEILQDNSIVNITYKMESESFELTLFDSGILRYLVEKDFDVDTAMADRYAARNEVILELSKTRCVKFWESEYSAYIDCVFEKENGFVPVEIKISDGRRSKSIQIFDQKYNAVNILCLGNDNYNIEGKTIRMPIYALCKL